MERKNRKHIDSFKDAWAGILWAIKTQPNFRIHIILSVLALGAGWYLGISSVEMAIIVFTIILGLTGEMINTSLESMTDLITTQYHENAKIAKDVAAGMMLITAIGAVLVAMFIFVPYIQQYFFL